MALIVADRVLETSTTTGTSAYTLTGAITGYRTAASVCVNNDTFTYFAEDVDGFGRPQGGWETGLGTWGTGNILTRTTIYSSSNANAAVSWAAGTRRIGLSVNSIAAVTSLKTPTIYFERNAGGCGISWYSSSYYAWTDYMSNPGALQGPNKNITAPTGTLVTSWARRSYIENIAGYGWTFESAANTTTPTVVAEINSAGAARFGGRVLAPSYTVSAQSSSGYGFWDTQSYVYGILMSASTDVTYGGRISGEDTSDYNMYFTMSSGTNRGFVFRSNYATPIFSVNPDGIRSNVGVTITGALNATTKSFLIDHPTKPNYKLQYGSLESPYHGVRLTGKDKIVSSKCKVNLPEYISGLCKSEDVNIQITNINHSKTIYIDSIDIENNYFTVSCKKWFFDNSEYEFFWSFTGIRRDVTDLIVESKA